MTVTTIPCRLCSGQHPEPPNICPGNCNRPWEAAERHQANTGEPHHLQPNAGAPLWCYDCTENIRTTLIDIPNQAAPLSFGGKLNTPAADLGRTTRADVHTSPSPAWDLYDEITRWAQTIEDDTRARLGHPQPDTNRYLHRSVSYLAGHLSPILTRDPDGIIFGRDVFRWASTLATVTGTRPLIQNIPGTCPRCDRRGQLAREDGTTHVKCTGCNAWWDETRHGLLAKAATG